MVRVRNEEVHGRPRSLLLKTISSARQKKNENAINPKTQLHTTNPWKEEKKKMTKWAD